jgi:DNA sulfur modification protein DndC
MRSSQIDMFSPLADRMPIGEQMELSLQSLQAYGPQHEHWAVAWSGGKDSSATLTLLCWLIDSGKVLRPRTLTVFYADTRMELPPLAIAAQRIMDELAERGIEVRIVRAPLDKRFFVYILGRGVPPPNNNTLRWCTRQIKVEPMQDALVEELERLGGSALMITGVRQGESAIRDRRIEMSCGKDGAECGQGWYQKALPEAKELRDRIATVAPLLHWRVCHVWEWLKHWAPLAEYGDWSTAIIADAYGGDEAEEINARTGCTGCPLASEERALDTILRNSRWAHLAPLKRSSRSTVAARAGKRLRKAGAERLKDGSFAKNPQRMGPLTFEAPPAPALNAVLDMQREAGVDFIDAQEEARIRELIAAETWPDGWDGDEPTADTPIDLVFRDGTIQPLLIGADG